MVESPVENALPRSGIGIETMRTSSGLSDALSNLMNSFQVELFHWLRLPKLEILSLPSVPRVASYIIHAWTT
jgi:hypothetical protein